MLSVPRCRAILGPDAPSSDAEIEQLRERLYTIAGVWLQLGARLPASPSARFLAALPEEARIEVEERAALMEFDGGMPRAYAERAALAAFETHRNRRIH